MPICPRCGMPGSPYKAKIGNKLYLYYAHRVPGGKKNRTCYIGPVSGYDLVAGLYNIDMQHAFSVEHKFNVFNSLLGFFTNICGENKEDDICREFRARLRVAVKEVGDNGE